MCPETCISSEKGPFSVDSSVSVFRLNLSVEMSNIRYRPKQERRRFVRPLVTSLEKTSAFFDVANKHTPTMEMESATLALPRRSFRERGKCFLIHLEALEPEDHAASESASPLTPTVQSAPNSFSCSPLKQRRGGRGRACTGWSNSTLHKTWEHPSVR